MSPVMVVSRGCADSTSWPKRNRSSTRTSWPRASSLGTRTEPTYPAPPVTSTVLNVSFTSSAPFDESRAWNPPPRGLVRARERRLHVGDARARADVGLEDLQAGLRDGHRRRMKRLLEGP